MSLEAQSPGSESVRRFPAGFWRNPLHILAFGFGSGLAPRGPGTAGTLVAALLFLGMQSLPRESLLLVVALAFVAGVGLCGLASERLGVKDHPGIVWDEFVGYWLAMCFAPPGLFWVLAGFVLFRLFDIWKPWPIGWVDRRVQGGFGIMLDDLIAGLYAGLVLALAAWLHADGYLAPWFG